jgi:hypothetical protein
MAFSPDILVTALQELLPGYSETWTKFHPGFDLIVEKGGKTKLKNPYVEFGLTPEGPGTINDIGSDPDRFLNGGRRQSSVRGNEYAATLAYVYDVPGQDLREANGEADLVQLIKSYPERALMDFKETIARQLVMGNGPGAGSVFTLNGDATYNPKNLGARSGMFEFAAPAAQNNTIHGVVANSIVGWHTQYRHITAMGGDGLKQMRGAYWDALTEGSSPEGPVNLMLGDRDSFDNYIDELTDIVQFIDKKAASGGDPAPGSNVRKGVAFHDAVFYPEPYITRADFVTAAAQAGVIYGVNTSLLSLRTQGSDAKMETGGDFAHRGPTRLPTQDMFRYEYILSLLIHTRDLRRHFSVTGGANP